MATDVLFINPGNAQAIYQGLASTVAAIEPPTWALLLAESCRSQGNQVILNKFGQKSLETINEILKHKLKRDLYS